MKNTDLRDIVETSLFAALIFLGVSVFRIPMPFTTQFVHFWKRTGSSRSAYFSEQNKEQ